MNQNKEFEIEFSFLEKRLKVKIMANSDHDALSEMMKSLMAKIQVHTVAEIKNFRKRGS